MTPIEVEPHPRATAAVDRVRRMLLDARVAAGHWEGELSSSALSTATASFALWLCGRSSTGRSGRAADAATGLARAGVRWLTSTQNADGGWGDTTRSRSNISTTALCWAALGAIGGGEAVEQSAARATAWLMRAGGSTDPAPLSEAIAQRYGDDRTFSVPILTMCALAGRFGAGPQAWQHVPQLPFELAAFPQGLFRFLRLPVVSYALPALIAIGLVRHRNRPARNPVARGARALARSRSLRALERIQPSGGGFLEAAPLTSFVAMSLIACGEAGHQVVERGIGFLVRSARPDGSWPIDTNLATWVTTLSVNALSPLAAGSSHEQLSAEERARILRWLLNQQYRQRHPYTGTAPGGWAWTDLPGGVPDADDTAGALIALHHLSGKEADDETVRAASAGITWLLDIQNGDGGIPTFCRGWGRLPFDRSAPELTAHALEAWFCWRSRMASGLAARIERAALRAVSYLRARQRSDGAWIPLWFGNEAAPAEENATYGTARVLVSLAAAGDVAEGALRETTTRRGVDWLLAAQNGDGGWGGATGVASSIEETGHALAALASADGGASDDRISAAIATATAWIVARVDTGHILEPAPIGLYFAKLWYSERLYPLIASLAGLSAAARRGQAAALSRHSMRPSGGQSDHEA